MSKEITITLDDETAAYLDRIAADQARPAGEVAAWIVTDDLRREQAFDAQIEAEEGPSEMSRVAALRRDLYLLPPHLRERVEAAVDDARKESEAHARRLAVREVADA